ncbi:MAG: fibronectin type III domain-containing protein, partial [Lachnospiraceae bacterium]|nr:fibronectin type III domain-containing protein [Lachnospiraceae bacterium]
AGADGYEIFLVGQGLVGKIADNNTTSYTLEGLKPGTTYYTMVRAYWGERGGTYSAVLTRATSGPAPSGLARSDVTATSATIRWNAAAGAPSGYVVYRDGVRLGAATATQFTDNDLTPGVAVKYTVRAYWNNDDTQMGAMSSALSVTPPGPLPSLRGFSTTPTSIMVNWNAITGDVNLAGFQGYRVYISGELVDENVITATSRTINNLSPNTLYQVQIAGVWNGREGRRANAASIRTAGPAPGGLARVSLTATSAAIKWNAVNPSPSGYIVYRDGVELATTKATGFTDNSLTPGVAVRYAVRAFWGEEAQLGAASGTLNLTPPGGTVSGLRAVPGTVGPTGATVAWQGAAGVAGASVTGYNVYLLVDGKAADPVPSATLNASLHNLNPATRYQVQVAPVWKIGSEDREGRRSNPVNITTAGPAPAWAPPSVTSTSVALSWNPPANASGLTGYRISRAVGKGAFEEYAEVGNVRAWKDEDVNPGQPYRYIIQALWGEGKPGNNSAVRTVTPPGPAPTRFSVVREDGTAALRWSLTNAADNQNVNAFLITKTVGAAVEEIRIPRTSSLNFMWNDMKFMNPGVTVRYQVQALWGAEVAGNTVTGGKPGNKTATRSLTPSGASGAAPGGLKAAVAGPTRVNVSWNAIAEKNAGGLLSYNLYLDGRLVKNVPKGGTRFVTLENLNPGQQYQVKVVGVWTSADMNWLGAREGKSSPIVRVRPTGAAPASLNVAANTLTGTSVRLTWRPVTQPEVWGYRIMRAVGGAAAVSVDITMAEYLANGNGWTDTGLSPGVPARYSVSALWEISDDEGEPLLVPGAMSKSRNVRPLGVAPSSVAGTAGSPTSITVTWNPPPNVAGASVGGYRVEIFAPATKAGPRALVGETEARGPLRATFSGLSPHSAYQVRVTPLWDCGVGGEREGLASGFVNVATR